MTDLDALLARLDGYGRHIVDCWHAAAAIRELRAENLTLLDVTVREVEARNALRRERDEYGAVLTRIADQPICGPAATWWDLRDWARVALGRTDTKENAR